MLAYAALRDTTRDRVTAQAAWRDRTGGSLRGRCVGWRGVDRLGLALRHFAPAGREGDAITFQLVCRPHDYSDRGSWERRRTHAEIRAAWVAGKLWRRRARGKGGEAVGWFAL